VIICVSQLTLECQLLDGGKKTFSMSQMNYIGTVMLKRKNFFSEVFEIYEPSNCPSGTAGNGRLVLSFILGFKFSGRSIYIFCVCLAETWQNRGLLPAWPSSVTTGSVKGEFAIGFNRQ